MDTLGVNGMLPEQGGFPDVDEVELNLEGSGNLVMDSAGLDDLIQDESKTLDLRLDDSDIEKLMNSDGLNLGDIDLSREPQLDQLAMLPIQEIDDKNVENYVTASIRNANTTLPQQVSRHMNNTNIQQNTMQMPQPDPLLGTRSMENNNQGLQKSMSQMIAQQSQQIQRLANEADALQRLVDEAIDNPGTNNPTMPVVNAPVPLDLEQEKMKLLAKLQEINEKQNMATMVQQKQQPLVQPNNNMFLQNTNSNRVQQPQQAPPASVASLGGLSTAGETPLTSFLRKNKKNRTPTVSPKPTVPSARSMLSTNVPGAPKAASIFSASPMEFDNPLMQKKKQQPLYGAMDRTQLSQNMVRQLSATGLMSRNDSAKLLGRRLASQESGGGNAHWGDTRASYTRTAGMLPKHASENHLLRGSSKSNLYRNRSKNSLSRENLLHMKRTGSKNQIHRDDSLGQLLPVKRQSGASKHRMGSSRSVPHMMMNNGGGNRGMPSSEGYQKNAMW